MPRPVSRPSRLLALAAFTLVVASFSSGCDPNRDHKTLIPTGLRPRPAVGPGTITGTVSFSPAVVPDLGIPPPVRIELWAGDTLSVQDSLPAGVTRFTLTGLQVATYTVYVSAPAFVRTSIPPVFIGDYGVDVGDIRISIKPTIHGRVLFDPVQAPDLVTPPFPFTTVELWNGATRVAEDSLGASDDVFRFPHLEPGTYSLVLRSRVFQTRTIAPIDAPLGDIDLGDVGFLIDPARIASSMQLSGDINGYEVGLPSYMGLASLGGWLGPSLIALDGSGNEVPGDTTLTLAAGTYAFRFLADGDLSGATGYGGDGSTLVDLPVEFAPVSVIAGAGHDIQVRVSSAGRYRFFLDERRLTFSAVRVPAPAVRTLRRPIR
jgi:hypothetical protein